MNEEKSKKLAKSKTETSLDIAATVASAVPWLGGPISNVLTGISAGRRFHRIEEVVVGLAEDLKDFRSGVSENYAQSREFQELGFQTLRRVLDEHNEQKRRIYRAFLVGAIKSPGESYDEQLRFLRTLEELQGDHIRVVRALMQTPESITGGTGSQISTLERRLRDMKRERITDLVDQLNAMRITKLADLDVTMSAHGAANLQKALTPYGRRLVAYIQHSERD